MTHPNICIYRRAFLPRYIYIYIYGGGLPDHAISRQWEGGETEWQTVIKGELNLYPEVRIVYNFIFWYRKGSYTKYAMHYF